MKFKRKARRRRQSEKMILKNMIGDTKRELRMKKRERER